MPEKIHVFPLIDLAIDLLSLVHVATPGCGEAFLVGGPYCTHHRDGKHEAHYDPEAGQVIGKLCCPPWPLWALGDDRAAIPAATVKNTLPTPAFKPHDFAPPYTPGCSAVHPGTRLFHCTHHRGGKHWAFTIDNGEQPGVGDSACCAPWIIRNPDVPWEKGCGARINIPGYSTYECTHHHSGFHMAFTVYFHTTQFPTQEPKYIWPITSESAQIVQITDGCRKTWVGASLGGDKQILEWVCSYHEGGLHLAYEGHDLGKKLVATCPILPDAVPPVTPKAKEQATKAKEQATPATKKPPDATTSDIEEAIAMLRTLQKATKVGQKPMKMKWGAPPYPNTNPYTGITQIDASWLKPGGVIRKKTI
jgi:hypothetical protein